MRRFLQESLIVIAVVGVMNASRASADAELGQAAPALIVEELNGNPFDLSDERGKVTIVNFWATWCEPCRKETPAIEAVFRRYHDQGLDVIGVSADRPHDRSSVKEMAQSMGYPAAMLEDADRNGFGSPTELPVTYVIDREGVVRDSFTPDKGTLTEELLTNTVVPLLQQKPAAIATTAETTPPPKSTRKSFWNRLFREF
jgi:cytochrome c biogenesis protein CcmG, thiol:disulfide interchange protein DsbE